MQHAGLRLLGVFLKTHGIKGHLVLKLYDFIDEKIEEGEPVFVSIDGIPVPFFISEFLIKTDETAIIKFDETDDENQAQTFTGCNVYSELKSGGRGELPEKGGEIDLSGFRVVDGKYGDTGILKEIVELPENPVMIIDYKGSEILVPFHKDIVRLIDYENRLIEISAPDGLLELYL